MKVILVLLWIGVLFAAGLAALILLSGMSTASGAPQEAVVCALAVAVAVIPYVFTRAVEGIGAASISDQPKTVSQTTNDPRSKQSETVTGLNLS